MTPMKIYTYVDNSNVYIEGCRFSAVKKGMSPSVHAAMNDGVVDHSWNIDYGRFHEFLCGADKKEIGAAHLWGSPPPSDSFWSMVQSKGFQVETFDKSLAGKEKKVDVAIAHRMTKDAYTLVDKRCDELTLVSGDKDFVPVVDDLVQEGFKVIIAFWSNAANELKNSATRYICLDSYFDLISAR
jgi:uncharacterized LabA/DUF88 family protein